ncbi:MAG TPA: MBL fold metallo-hydrolase [Pyrinomonadaceae bacterium]|nr:MBL fold metallo-hydrolase [Pyrinomonadaceae bacterium]
MWQLNGSTQNARLVVNFSKANKNKFYMNQNRRQFLTATAGFAISISALNQLNFGQTKAGTRLILLGTKGGPRVGKGRRNPSTLLLINDIPYLVDCGYGTSLQLIAAGVALNKLRYIFITHHHSDHNLEYGPLIYNAWATGLPIRIDSYGPPGLKHMTQTFFEYMKLDIDVRIVDEGRPDPRKLIFAHDFINSGIVMQNDNVKVTAAKVRHPLVKQAFAFRFDTKDRSIVISGDTAYSPELIGLAKGADVLVHEVMYLPALEELIKRVPNAARFRQHLLASHSTPEDVGKVASQAGVKIVVLNHFVPGDDPSITDEQWTEGVRKYFKGQVIVGKDLMEI